ncbi:MAG: endonuclease/exonuclease/phosphatase family protein [Candidatus Thiodiazotropha sp. (ex Ctena orbiculata)]|nr:endonuclease/exonuclease/phosphatase family protein [Candidatus Thiodiazotropha taylori]
MRLFFALFTLIISASVSADQLRIATWNIENLGTYGRGSDGGHGEADLPLRTKEQLNDIADFIRDDLGSDVIALQEIGITHAYGPVSRNTQLDAIVKELGSSWKYYLPPVPYNHTPDSMYVGYLWNTEKVKAIAIAPMRVPQVSLAGAALFSRTPVIGFFEAKDNDKDKDEESELTDFALVNVNLAPGQQNDENHLIAMTLIEYRLDDALKAMNINEEDRIILGDFNDNPQKVSETGTLKYSPAMYYHMAFKGYMDYVPTDFKSTRMDTDLNSIVDHVLVSQAAQRHLFGNRAFLWLPENAPESFAEWRETYSNHFPVSVVMNITEDDDED